MVFKQLANKLKKSSSLPFLFIGSGMSKRYLNLESWEKLLEKFALKIHDSEFAYNMYEEEAKQKLKASNLDITDNNLLLPMVADCIERDFNKMWYTSTEFAESRQKHGSLVKDGASPFKVELGAYFYEESSKISFDTSYHSEKEISLLKQIGENSISGIITTNYDSFLERLLSNYDIFTGQEELLFSKFDGTLELYKIHGCCTKPRSIIINSSDYKNFKEKNAYLAAKLMTMFLEHPIIFLGYSIRDTNIEDILEAIVKCLNQEQLEKLKERLFFIERKKSGQDESIDIYKKSFDSGKHIEMTRITTDNFEKIYEVISQTKAKTNLRLIKKIQKDIYSFILTTEPTNKMYVNSMDLDKIDDMEIAVDVGVLSKLGSRGYCGIKAEEVFKDIIFDTFKNEFNIFDVAYFVENSLSEIMKHTGGSLPIYKYIRSYDGELHESIKKNIKNKFTDFLTGTIIRYKRRAPLNEKSIDDLRTNHSDIACIKLIPLLDEEYFDIGELELFIKDLLKKYPNILKKNNYCSPTEVKRLIKIYDWLRYGKSKYGID